MTGNRLDKPIGQRTCYSCGSSYPEMIRFCPKDSTDLEYAPQNLDSLSRHFKGPVLKWTVIAGIGLLLVWVGFLLSGVYESQPETAATRGELTVRTTPTGASVYLDGTQVGISPVRLSNIPTGVHGVKVVFPGYSEGQANVEILPSATQKLVWDLSPLPAHKRLIDKKKYIAETFHPYSPSSPVSS